MGYEPQWYLPEGRKKIMRPRNPLFPLDTAVNATVLHYRKSRYDGPDVDNVVKAIADGITSSGLWFDDRQVDTWFLGRKYPSDRSYLVITVSPVYSDQLPSPFTRKEWIEQQRMEEAMPELHPIEVLVFCQRCSIGIGRGTIEDEVWLLPNRKRGIWELKPICGQCADVLNLDLAYRAMSVDEIYDMPRLEASRLLFQRRKEILHVLSHTRQPKRLAQAQ